ncbi:hypothetical protein MHH81_20480 [Psychrobacillus sp. FSL H8-0484]
MKNYEREYLIKELLQYHVGKGPRGENLQDMDYFSLRSLLATKRAARG